MADRGQLQQEDGDEIVTMQMAKDTMRAIVALRRYTMKKYDEQVNASANDAEEPDEAGVDYRVESYNIWITQARH